MRIPYNKPYLSGREIENITDAVKRGHISGDGYYTRQCHNFLEVKYGFRKVLLTHSCTAALEMAVILAGIKPGDEVIMPSFTFVSTANAFVLRGARIVFCDSRKDHPNMDIEHLETLITDKTKAIVPVHYAGMACDMDKILAIAAKHNLYVIEDAAQCINACYKGRPLGSIGHFGCMSFHETKNIQCGEGGLLIINDDKYTERAEIIREKGTDRSKFFRGEIDKYGWVDVGSSYLPSDMNAAYLYAQLENAEDIIKKRVLLWNRYYKGLLDLETEGHLRLPKIPEGSSNNGHIFYIICNSGKERNGLLKFLKDKGIGAVFHYQALHQSKMMAGSFQKKLPEAEKYTECLLRLPLYYELVLEEQNYVIESVRKFFKRES
ncbi:MAG: dTDP-4-amino-4,6-dideoxygalactose transaminase [Saprospiraceae bacterium]|nr:dTDP-4-amino-4,6-dideoxygalactose transaminase [Saprospiraceae bacterium]